ncbi:MULTISPECIES: hypothetical protein [Kitasatospora]|uniref:DUF4145 domain-containing protein n=1 Tax=Kitasatospora setae (strain ATCC 33774 / DSM 43861 / JCM 3304 / KCC A-0304 / NBRC 14216 / KM-6054) TaxID=452652 RepID=E4N6N6_KITSK|nr:MULTISPECIES: hypothetical protein [Kitasatospora]BAJ26867.1 hypothetical protein KSE_10320 [Kitasatospora setae KM-6054]
MNTRPPLPDSLLLDENTVAELARVVTGDDDLYYRKGYEIEGFLRRAGWQDVPAYDGQYRREWALELLMERRDRPAEIEKVLLRLADAREYLDEPELLADVLAAVNSFLVHEGLRLEAGGNGPRLLACDPALAHPSEYGATELRVAMADIIQDPAMVQLLQRRLDEARTCYAHGAHVAAIVMLGSLMEGVLLQTVVERDRTLLGNTAPRNAKFEGLIDLCHTAGWIDGDAQKFSHVLRRYRNFVHPDLEAREAHRPDRDTLGICWQVVNAALNDLAASAGGTQGSR